MNAWRPHDRATQVSQGKRGGTATLIQAALRPLVEMHRDRKKTEKHAARRAAEEAAAKAAAEAEAARCVILAGTPGACTRPWPCGGGGRGMNPCLPSSRRPTSDRAGWRLKKPPRQPPPRPSSCVRWGATCRGGRTRVLSMCPVASWPVGVRVHMCMWTQAAAVGIAAHTLPAPTALPPHLYFPCVRLRRWRSGCRRRNGSACVPSHRAVESA